MRIPQLIKARPARDLALVFAFTVLLPGLVLAFVGVRALLQERALAAQEIRERLDRSTSAAAQSLERELLAWRALLDAVARTGTLDAGGLTAELRQAAAEPGGAAVVAAGPGGEIAWPRGALAYPPWSESAALAQPRRPETFLDAERIELAEKNYPRAIAAYTQLLATSRGDDRAWLLHRLARCQRKAGRGTDARRTLEQLAAQTTTRVGTLQTDLIARYELTADDLAAGHTDRAAASAVELYRDLVNGLWPLEKSRYLYYADTARGWAIASNELARLSVLDEAKRALSDAFAADAPPRAFIVMDRRLTSGAPVSRAALAVSVRWLQTRHWPELFATATVDGFDVTVTDADGDVLYGPDASASMASGSRALATSRQVQESGVSLRVSVRPENPGAVSSTLARRQTVLVVMLVAVLAIMGCGAYFSLRVMRREIEIARMKSDFVSAVSHEFRSPLTAIRQLAEMLMRGRVPNDTRRQEYYARISRESDRLSRVVENLLDFARMEEGRKPYRFEKVDTSAWLESVAARFETQILENGHHLVAEIPPALPGILADRDALSTVLDNLLDNAVKYSAAPATVWLDANARDAGVTIRVRDRGIGIATSDQPHVFDRFYRGTEETTHQVRGTGLGLSLVQHIVQAHGGRITFESRSGEGTTFSVHLQGARTA